MFRSALLAMAIFAGLAGAAAVSAHLAAATAESAPAASWIPLTPGPADAAAGDPTADGTLSRAAIARQQRAAAAALPPSVQDLVRSAFQPLGDGVVAWALKIAWCESKYDPNAVNGASGAQGLFQFLPSTWRGTPYAAASPFDPGTNARAAAWLYQTYGPTQWECVA